MPAPLQNQGGAVFTAIRWQEICVYQGVGNLVSIEKEGVEKVTEDLEGGTEDGIEHGGVHTGGIGVGKGRMGEMNIIE